MAKKDVYITHQGNIPDRWIAEAKRRITAHATTQVTERQETADIVVFLSDSLVHLDELASRYPHAALLVISPSITDVSTITRNAETPKMGYLSLTANAAFEIIGALSKLQVIPDASFKL